MSDGDDSVLRAITDDGAFRVVVARTTSTVRGVLQAQHARGPSARPFGDLITGSVLFRETMAPNLRVQGVLKGVGGRGSLVADSHPSGMTRGLMQLPEGAEAVDTNAGALLQLMRTLPGGRINQGVVELPAGGCSATRMGPTWASRAIPPRSPIRIFWSRACARASTRCWPASRSR